MSIAHIAMFIKAVQTLTWDSACEEISANKNILWESYVGITCMATVRRGASAPTIIPKYSWKTISSSLNCCTRSSRSHLWKLLFVEAVKSLDTKSTNAPSVLRFSLKMLSSADCAVRPINTLRIATTWDDFACLLFKLQYIYFYYAHQTIINILNSNATYLLCGH